MNGQLNFHTGLLAAHAHAHAHEAIWIKFYFSLARQAAYLQFEGEGNIDSLLKASKHSHTWK